MFSCCYTFLDQVNLDISLFFIQYIHNIRERDEIFVGNNINNLVSVNSLADSFNNVEIMMKAKSKIFFFVNCILVNLIIYLLFTTHHKGSLIIIIEAWFFSSSSSSASSSPSFYGFWFRFFLLNF